MKMTWRNHSGSRIERGAAKIPINPLLSDNASMDEGSDGYISDKNSTERGDR